MKPLRLLSLLLVFSFGAVAQAELLFSPFWCPVQDALVWVHNPSSQAQHLWFQDPGSQPFHEVHVEMAPHEKKYFYLTDFYTADSSAFAVKHFANLQIHTLCKDSNTAFELSGQDSPWKSLILPSAGPASLSFINRTQQKNKVLLQYKIAGQSKESEIILEPEFKSTTWKVPGQVQGEIKVRAQGRMVAFALQADEQLTLKEETLKNPQVEETRYFLFSSQDPDNKATYVVPMRSQKMIVESLEQIRHPEKARLLVGRIEKSLNNTNRDMNSPTKTPWSWQVAEAQNYADFAHISCDGSPSIVQERLTEWIESTGGTICFWNYRVIREVLPSELR